MNNFTLEEDIVNYYALVCSKKHDSNLMHQVYIRLKLAAIKEKILSSIDDNILSFEELYKLLKLLQNKLEGKIQFETCRYYFEDDIFSENVMVDGIEIIKGNGNTVNILFSKDYLDTNVCSYEMIPCELVKKPDIEMLLFELEVALGKDFNKLSNMIIAYLFKKLK